MKSILRKNENINFCEKCGKRHVLSYGGKDYCQSPHYIGHMPTGALSPREKEVAALFGTETHGFKTIEEAREWMKAK